MPGRTALVPEPDTSAPDSGRSGTGDIGTKGDREELRVRVVLDSTGTPVADALVEVFAFGGPGGLSTELHTPGDEATEAHVDFAHTNSFGEVTVHRSQPTCQLHASHGPLRAEAVLTVTQSVEVLELRLRQPTPLTIRVRDTAGSLVPDVPVCIARLGIPPIHYEVKSTGADGTCRFYRLDRMRMAGITWAASFAFPTADMVEVQIPDSLPTVVDLTLRDTGDLVISTVDPAGAPLPPAAYDVLVYVLRGDGTRTNEGPWGRLPLTANGRLDLRVERGLALEVALERRKSGEVLTRQSVTTHGAGRTTHCELVWSEPAPETLAGRFVFATGAPWTAAQARATIASWPGNRETHEVFHIQDDGRFRLPLHHPAPANGGRRVTFAAEVGDEGETATAVLDLPKGLTDAGDIVLDLGELICSGQLIDEDDKPVEQAVVQLAIKTGDPERPFRQIRTSWRRVTAADGRFVIRALPGIVIPHGELALAISAVTHARLRVPIVRGARDLAVTLQTAARFSGQLQLATGAHGSDLQLRLVREGVETLTRTCGSNGRFRFEFAAPGIWSFEVWHLGPDNRPEGTPFARIDGIELRGGIDSQDDRVNALMVPARFRGIDVLVKDADGHLLRGAKVRTAEAPPEHASKSDFAGISRVRAERWPADLLVTAAGHRPALVENVDTDTEVQLERGITARVLAPEHPGGTTPFELHARIVRVSDDSAPIEPLATLAFTDNRFLDVSLPAAGVYELLPIVVLGDRIGQRIERVATTTPTRIEIRDSTDLQTFSLNLAVEDLVAAVAAAAAR